MKLVQNDPRVERLQALCRKEGKDGILLSLAHNVMWLMGARAQVGISTSGGICELLVKMDGVYLLTNNIETERLRTEELCSDAAEICTYPWHSTDGRDKILRALCPNGYLRDSDCENALYPLRTILLPAQQQELRENCATASAIIEESCFAVQPGMTEFEIAGLVAQKVYAVGMEPIILIVACDERILNHRHPMPTANRLKNCLMLSLGARRNGQYVSITRFVSFGKPSEQVLRAQRLACQVTAMLHTETRPGVRCGDLFEKIKQEYAALGCPEQIELHHQGGSAGYQPRECKATAASDQLVQAGQVFAWNPSVTGYKSEDMLLIGETENTVLTITPKLPYEDFTYAGKAHRLPQILIR